MRDAGTCVPWIQTLCVPAVSCVPAMTDLQLNVAVTLMYELSFMLPTNTGTDMQVLHTDRYAPDNMLAAL